MAARPLDLAGPAVGTAGRVAGERTHPRRVTPRWVGRGFMGIADRSSAPETGGSDVQVDGLLG
ncbi:MAG TPA: hypothetical protein VNT27_01820 [Propionibacteriaceae bacterium]|nr:hypothetical protein [Propionibacteriaceae bacterium]